MSLPLPGKSESVPVPHFVLVNLKIAGLWCQDMLHSILYVGGYYNEGVIIETYKVLIGSFGHN